MNSILKSAGFEFAKDATDADVVFLNTCAIRDNAGSRAHLEKIVFTHRLEQKIWHRLRDLRVRKRERKKTRPLIVGVLGAWECGCFGDLVADTISGCMAERLKTKLIEEDQMVDLVAGPDAYRDLPRLLSIVDNGRKQYCTNTTH